MNNIDPLLDVAAFAAHLQGRGRLLGLDLGSKTIGVAISDSNWRIASAVDTVRRQKFSADAEWLLDYADREHVEGIVIGLPLNMDGSEGRRCQSTRTFQRNLSRLTELPMLLHDERLSSFAADQTMLEADLSRQKRAQKIDQIAAGYILQSALDCLPSATAKAAAE